MLKFQAIDAWKNAQIRAAEVGGTVHSDQITYLDRPARPDKELNGRINRLLMVAGYFFLSANG